MPFGSGGGLTNVSSLNIGASTGDLLDVSNDAGAQIIVGPTGKLQAVDSTLNAQLTASPADGLAFFRYNTAPADATLSAGELAFWFDPTNGAAKLMIKAKQNDGTVKTASVALA
jgi:hypothetical protein